MFKKIAIGFGILLVLGFIASLSSKPGTTPASTGGPSSIAIGATPAPAVTAAPTTPPTPTPQPTPVVLRGSGQTATDPITLPAAISIATFTNSGRSNFVVQVVRGTTQKLLINEIGPYQGSRPLTGTDPLRLNIESDGAWSVTIAPIQCCASSGAFAAKGDKASSQFTTPGTGTWAFSHDGQANFVVILHCPSGDQLVQNRIGAFQGTTILIIPPGACYWEVEADGNWSLMPR